MKLMTEDDWKLNARCRGLNSDIFFNEDRVAEAKSFCAECEVSGPCLDWAMENRLFEDFEGIYGGLTPVNRRTLGRRQRERR